MFMLVYECFIVLMFVHLIPFYFRLLLLAGNGIGRR